MVYFRYSSKNSSMASKGITDVSSYRSICTAPGTTRYFLLSPFIWVYGGTVEQDSRISARAAELAGNRGASMIEVSPAWLLTKATAPVVGATKKSQIDGFAKAVDFRLSEDEIRYLEELYIPHALVGVIAMNPVEIQAK